MAELKRENKPNKDGSSKENQDPVANKENEQLTSEKPQKLDIHFSKRRLFVVGFKSGTTEQELHKFFSQFGQIEDVSLLAHYAFVTFEFYYKFPPYCNKFKGTVVEAHVLAPKNDRKLKTKTILANGVLTNIPEDSIADYFSRFGKVRKVNKQQKGGIKRFAYVIFDKHESVEKAIETPCHLIEGKIVDIRKARENV